MKLTRENISDLTRRKSKEVQIGGYEVRIIEMTLPQQLYIESLLKDKKSNGDLIAPVLKFCVVDDKDQTMLEDYDIASLPSALAVKLFQHCIELNSISESDLENRAKNS